MESYLAKTKPKETIQEHTDNLIYNYDLIKRLYPNINVNWELLRIACIYHDLGKINYKFQDKLKNNKKHEDEVPHGFLSVAFLDTKELKKTYDINDIRILMNAIAFHHDREIPDEMVYAEEIEALNNRVADFRYDKIPNIKELKIPSKKYFNWKRIYELDEPDIFYKFIMLKGLLNRIDYAASAHENVELKNDFLQKLLDDIRQSWRKDNPLADWNELQNYMFDNQDKNIVVVAQTGMGKTEAGLLWIGDYKGFFTLPLKTAINSIYERIIKEIQVSEVSDKVGLLHSETYNEYIALESKNKSETEVEDEIDIEKYYTKTRQLSMPLTVCTIDQIFDFVYRYIGFELKPATLSYSKIVIDEIQMYSPSLLAYIVFGLSYITKMGGKFAILTATLSPFVVDVLRQEGIEFEMPDKPFINDKIRHSIKIMNEKINSDFIVQKYNKNKVLVICNTVSEAQRIYNELIEKLENNEEEKKKIRLFHSNFIKKDRKQKETDILSMGDKNSKEHGIWVCTQVVEASLDIDFDILLTELSDLNGLFQRMGRCYRNREFKENGYNCYVFNGGNKTCSGVGNFIDRRIFDLSKEALKEIDGTINEQDKIDLIESVYTTENIKDTEYQKKMEDVMEYLKNIYEYEIRKSEAVKMFRDINSITVIPKCVYEGNKETIDKSIEILNEDRQTDLSETELKELKKRKITAKNEIFSYTVSVAAYLMENEEYEILAITPYENIRIFDCNYNDVVGVVKKTNSTEKKELSMDERSI